MTKNSELNGKKHSLNLIVPNFVACRFDHGKLYI